MDSVLYKLTDCLPVDFFFFTLDIFSFTLALFVCWILSFDWLMYQGAGPMWVFLLITVEHIYEVHCDVLMSEHTV